MAGTTTLTIKQGVFMPISAQASQDLHMGTGGSYSASRDVIKHWIWDTRFFGTVISDNVYFSQPINSTWGAIGPKTKNETNFSDSGKLPNGQTILLKKIRVACISFCGTSATNGAVLAQVYTNILQSSIFEIKIPGREFDLQIQGSAFTPAMSIDSVSTNAQRKGDYIASGVINFQDSPIFVDQLVGITVLQTITNADAAVLTVLNAGCGILAGANCKMQVMLEGTLTRAK